MKKLFLVIIGLLVSSGMSFAQCAMCRATLETSVSNGESLEMASTLNFAILYLLALPYLLIVTVGVLWYKKSRNAVAAAQPQ